MKRGQWLALLLSVSVIVPNQSVARARQPQPPLRVWDVSNSVDPITGESRCVVAAYDKLRTNPKRKAYTYSRVGALYPVVELNSAYGLLVGVSSGGRFRVPTGDILWRVDDNPHRELRAADNPGLPSTQFAVPKTGNEEADRKVEEAMASTSKLAAAMTATSTVASGKLAAEMLREMLAGRALIYRSATVAPQYGVPTGREYEVGQYTSEGLKASIRPIPLDESFREGIRACGIAI